MADEQIVKPSDPSAATYRTDIKGWVSRCGHFYGDGAQGERTARFAGSTVSECSECGAVCSKSRVRCDACQSKATRARYDALPLAHATWDYPLAIFQDDRYFDGPEQVADYCEEHVVAPEDLLLVTVEWESLRQVDEDYWSDYLPDEADLPSKVAEALETLNAVICEHGKNVCYYAGNQRVALTWEDIGGSQPFAGATK